MTSPFLGSASGLTRQRLRGKAYERLSRDLYVLHPGPPDLRTRVEALRLVLPDAVPCLSTAALLQRLPVDDDGLLHLARGQRAPRSERAGVQVHRTPVDDDERLDLAGLPVTDGPRTFVDLAGRLPLEALVALGDVVLRRYDRLSLEAAVARRRKRAGLPLARHALTLLDAGADSPAETRMRLRLHLAGFTALRHGVVVLDGDRGWVASPDLADEAARVAVQHEGAVHFAGGVERWRRDLQRDELTRQAGWQVVLSTALDDRRPHLLVQKVAAAYHRASQLHGRSVLPLHLR